MRRVVFSLLTMLVLSAAHTAFAETGDPKPHLACGMKMPAQGIQEQTLPALGADGFYVADAKLKSSTQQGNETVCFIRQARFTYPDVFVNGTCPDPAAACPAWRLEMQLYDSKGGKVNGRLNYSVQTQKQQDKLLYTVNVQSEGKPLKGDYAIIVRIVAKPRPGPLSTVTH